MSDAILQSLGAVYMELTGTDTDGSNSGMSVDLGV